MCTGLEAGLILGGLALSAGGNYIQSQAQQKNAEARADARNAVLKTFQDKNEKLSEEARAALDKRLSMEDQTPDEAMEAPKKERTDETQAVLDRSRTSDPIPLGGNAPRVLSAELEKAQGDTAAGARERAEALAGTRAFGDMLFGKGLATQGAGRDIGRVNTFAQANQRLLPHQQDLAEQSKMGVGRGMGAWGGALSALGSLGSAAAGSGMLSGAGPTVANVGGLKAVRPAQGINLGL